MSKEFENIRNRIESKEFHSYSEARIEISSNLIAGHITKIEHAKLRSILNMNYND